MKKLPDDSGDYTWKRREVEKLVNQVFRQVSLLTTAGKDLRKRSFIDPMEEALKRLFTSFEFLTEKHHVQPKRLISLTQHGDLYANLLVQLGHSFAKAGLHAEGQAVWGMNRTLHGLDFFPFDRVPRVLQLTHPVGTVIGRADLGKAAIFYQGVTIGGARQTEKIVYPSMDGPTIFFANSTVLGQCHISKNVVFGANSLLIDCDVPEGSLVIGQFPNHRFIPGAEEIINKAFRGPFSSLGP